jgi:hypothetical protein
MFSSTEKPYSPEVVVTYPSVQLTFHIVFSHFITTSHPTTGASLDQFRQGNFIFSAG